MEFRRCEKRLGGDAALAKIGAAESVLLDQNDGKSLIGSGDRERDPTRSAADDTDFRCVFV